MFGHLRLAKAELYLTLATVFYRFDMELFETTRADIDPSRDYFAPGLKGESKGVRELVKWSEISSDMRSVSNH